MVRKNCTEVVKGGNTNKPPCPSKNKFRAWCFTDFRTEKPVFNSNDMKFLAFGSEICPKTGKHHWQGYIYWINPKTLSASSKYFGNAHVELIQGTPEDNKNYCSKDGKYEQFGTLPGQGFRTDLFTFKDAILNNNITVDNIAIECPEIYHQYGRTLSKIEDIALRKKFRTEMTTGIWYYGPTGVGKSHVAFQDFTPETHYVFPNDGGWYDAYTQQPTVIINDFRGEIPYNTMLQLVDKWPFSLRRRNREPMPFTSTRVIITSSLSPEQIYHNRDAEDSIEQLKRRFSVIELQRTNFSNTINNEIIDLDISL